MKIIMDSNNHDNSLSLKGDAGEIDGRHTVNFTAPRSFMAKLKSASKEMLFPDDPFKQIRNGESKKDKIVKGAQYFVPMFEWLSTYNLRLFWSDLVAGLTITSLAIPQGISYAKLAEIPPVIGLCKFFLVAFISCIFMVSFFFY